MSEQDIEVERVYTVPLARAWIAARHRRTRRAVNILREFAEHHMKSSEIKIDTELNEALWNRGITKPPRRITVKMEKDEDGVVTISLPKEAKKKPEPESPVTTKSEEPVAATEKAPTPQQTTSTASPATGAAKQEDATTKKPAKASQKKKPKSSDQSTSQ